MVEEPQAQSTQHIPSTSKVEGCQGSTTPKKDASKDKKIFEVQKEPESTFKQSGTFMQEQMELVLQNPQ